VQLLYLWKLSRPKYHEFSLKLLLFPMLQYYDINCKTVTILFYLLIIQLTVYKRTMTIFITDDKVVYQRVRREMRLASDNSWARVVWSIRAGELSCAHLNREWQFHTKSHELIGTFFGLSSWLSMRSSTATRWTRSTAAWLPATCTRFVDSLQQTVDAFKFPTFVGQFTQQSSCAVPLWQI